MKTLIQSIEIPPTMPMNPLGEYTHLLRLSFQHEDEVQQGLRSPSIFLLYSRKDNTVGQVTEEGAAECCIAVAFKGAETSRPECRHDRTSVRGDMLIHCHDCGKSIGMVGTDGPS